MDAITLLMTLFLNLNEPCSAMPAEEQRIAGQAVQILRYDCGAKQFKVWSRRCAAAPSIGMGDGFWGRPFFLEETTSQCGLYVNRFGEVVTGWHVSLAETYVPACGS